MPRFLAAAMFSLAWTLHALTLPFLSWSPGELPLLQARSSIYMAYQHANASNKSGVNLHFNEANLSGFTSTKSQQMGR